MDYEGVIIEESLKENSVLGLVNIKSTKVESITEAHKTPWLKQWTLHTVLIPEVDIEKVVKQISKALDNNYWYADFKNKKIHYIIFPNKVFKIDRTKVDQYNEATKYGVKLGIPDYQLDFSPNVIYWKRPEKSN